MRKIINRFGFQDLSIKRKLLIIIMSFSSIALFIVCTTFIVFEWRWFRQSMVRDLSTLAQVIGHNCSASLVFGDQNDARETLTTLQDKDSIIAAWVYTKEGKVFASYLRNDIKGRFSPPEQLRDGYYFGKDRLTVWWGIKLEGAELGRICLSTDLKEMYAILGTNIRTILVLLGVFSIVVFLASSKLAKVISTPILELARLAKDVSKDKKYFVRAKKRGWDELGSLIEAFNKMLEEIQKRDTTLIDSKHKAEEAAKNAEKLAEKTRLVNLDLEREVKGRKMVEKELGGYRDHLEDLVTERTKQLINANMLLEREIGERLNAEKNLKISLEEKTALLGEIHHRVKNNLQVISSLLYMSEKRTIDQKAIDLLSEAQAKIYTMALIHSQLYESDRFDQIDMEKHGRDIISHLATLYNRNKHIDFVVYPSEIYISVTQAVPFALALNELISNSFKHAFKDNQKGTIEVSMKESKGTISLEVKDDGVGIPGDIDIYKADSLGLKLVRNLVERQLKGKLQIKQNNGTEVLIEFKRLGKEIGHV
jgi:two-component sensor histidine kinase